VHKNGHHSDEESPPASAEGKTNLLATTERRRESQGVHPLGSLWALVLSVANLHGHFRKKCPLLQSNANAFK